jgi:hypothetical protein
MAEHFGRMVHVTDKQRSQICADSVYPGAPSPKYRSVMVRALASHAFAFVARSVLDSISTEKQSQVVHRELLISP